MLLGCSMVAVGGLGFGFEFGFEYWLLFGHWVLVLGLNCLVVVVGGAIWLISSGGIGGAIG